MIVRDEAAARRAPSKREPSSLAELLAYGGRVSGQMSVMGLEDDGAGQMSVMDSAAEDGAGQMSVMGFGKAPLRLRLTGDVAAFWRDVRRLFDASGEAGELVDFLIRSFWRVWLRRDPDQVAYHDVYERERYHCVSPVCSNRD